MEMSTELTRYVAWGGAVAIGALLAVLDRRWIRRPLFGALLIAGIGGGIIMTNVSPFSFAGGGYYMEGVLISGASALALIGYLFAVACQFLHGRLTGRGRL